MMKKIQNIAQFFCAQSFSTICFSSLETIVASDLILDTVGDLESQQAFPSMGGLFTGLHTDRHRINYLQKAQH